MQPRSSASTWALVAMLVLAVFAACAEHKEAPPQKGAYGQGVYVDEAWTTARDVTGHRIHVVKEKIDCTKCHSPTATGMGPVTPDRCATCHEKEARIAHASDEAAKRFGPGTKAVCTACHAFTLDGSGHDKAMLDGGPPRVAMDGGAGKYAFGIETYEPGDCKRCHATQQGDTAPVVVHGTQPCLSCHKPHEGTPQSAPCSDCHQEITTSHAAQGKTLVETCSTCHEHRHAAAKEALGTCTECHAKTEPLIPASALFAGGHAECTGCHKPHAFDKKETAPCRSCHQAVNVIGAGTIGAHDACVNCHAPHDVKASAGAACPTCHKGVHSDHPKQAGACTSCHDPHPKRASSALDVEACSSCHRFAKNDHDAHGGAACTGCHKPHQFGLELTNLATCDACHGTRVDQVAANRGHQACTGCHQGLPHHPQQQKVACSSCHAREAGLVKSGHATCTGCHEPHSGAQGAACGTCHRAEQQTAPKGHQACASCHEPHAGLPAVKACNQCHATEAASPHGTVGTGCQTCHRPHGPKGVASVPACTSCHAVAKLPGLHSEAKHQPCQRCHAGHEAANTPKREICVGCHQDRKTHFPESPRCASCHLFTATP